MTTATEMNAAASNDRKAALNRRLEEWGWGLFLIMTGGIWLVPAARVPHGTWLIGTGMLLLSLNAVRHLNAIPASLFTTALGALALAGGLADLAGLDLPLLAICLIVVGAGIVLKPLLVPRA